MQTLEFRSTLATMLYSCYTLLQSFVSIGFIETRFSATELKRFITRLLQPRTRHVMNRKHSQEHHYPMQSTCMLCTHSNDFMCEHMECVTSCQWGKPFWYCCEGEGDLAPLFHACWWMKVLGSPVALTTMHPGQMSITSSGCRSYLHESFFISHLG